VCIRKERLLECRTESVQVGRRFVADCLAGWGFEPGSGSGIAIGDMLLVATELLANAVRACQAAVILEVVGHHNYVEISVVDSSPEPAVVVKGSPDRTSGRGLEIVEAVSSEWGQTPFDGRMKRVWCRVTIPSTPGPLAAALQLTRAERTRDLAEGRNRN
jgi:hypothetical protein